MKVIPVVVLKEEICKRYPRFRERLAISPVFEAIAKTMSIDAELVVRCNQCKWWGEEYKPDGRRCCDLLGIRFEPEFWCAYGERKEE